MHNFHRTLACLRCGNKAPSFIYTIRKKPKFGVSPSEERTRKAKILIQSAKEISRDYDVGTTLEVLHQTRPSRFASGEVLDGYYTQIFIGEYGRVILSGVLKRDPCRIESKAMRNMVAGKKKLTTFRLPTDLHSWFRDYCKRNEISMTTVVINYLKQLRDRDRRNTKVTDL
jgi:hypothetical protein